MRNRILAMSALAASAFCYVATALAGGLFALLALLLFIAEPVIARRTPVTIRR